MPAADSPCCPRCGEPLVEASCRKCRGAGVPSILEGGERGGVWDNALQASGLELARRTPRQVPEAPPEVEAPPGPPRSGGRRGGRSAAKDPQTEERVRAGQARWELPAREAALELRLRVFAVPVALLVTWLVAHAGITHMLMRTFLSMWVHELGHAVTAWLFGFPAFPGPWFTPIGAERSWLFSGAFTAAVGYLGYRNVVARRAVPVILCALTLQLQALLTLGVSAQRAQQWMIFGGDAGCLVLGTLLMTTFYARRSHSIRTGWLRWGFLVIGAASFADAYATWWAARTDIDAIPFGENEGRGLSDPTRLVDEYGWSIRGMVNAYVVLGALCLVALAVVYVIGLAKARAAMRDPSLDPETEPA